MTSPAQAIKAECRRCKGGQLFRCESKVCKLSPDAYTCRSSVRRIGAHCRDCNGDDHPRECVGRYLDGTTCGLHPFRLGKNPERPKRTLSPEQRAKMEATLAKNRSRIVGQMRFQAVGSTISSGVRG